MGKVTRLTGGECEAGPEGLHLREISGEAAPPPENVGRELRAARLSRGQELAEVSQALRIGKGYLEALETDLPEKLPGRTYAIGFVRSYAHYLGLDAPSLVSRYKLATTGLPESAPQVGPAPEPGSPRRSLVWILPAVAAAALLVYGFYELSRSPAPAPANASARMQVGTGAPTATSAPPKLAVRSSPAAVPAQPVPGIGPAAVPTGRTFGAQNRDARVVLHALALTHVLVEGPDGRIYMNRVLHPGDVYRVPDLVGLALTTPNGGSVSLELDGRDMGAAGATGRITEALSLDPRAIVDRKPPAFPANLAR